MFIAIQVMWGTDMGPFECPWCHRELVRGRIFAPSSHCTYWLPDSADINGFLTVKRVENAGGIVVDSATKVGFFSKMKSETWYCSQCQMLVTKLLESNEQLT